MPVPQWSWTVSEVPRLAPPDFRTLPRRKQVWEGGNWPGVRGLWHGSGFQVARLPGAHWYHAEDTVVCGACGSRRTRCIYCYAEPAQTWIVMRIEILCSACGKFTQWEGED
jgi:hypothetical protein